VLTLSGLLLSLVVDPSNPPIWFLGIPPAAVNFIFKPFYGFGMTLDKVIGSGCSRHDGLHCRRYD
jgi:hypothetical protein